MRAGDLTGLGDGAFFFTFEELSTYWPARMLRRPPSQPGEETYERYKALPPYPLIIRGRFDPFQWATDPDRRSDVFDSHGLLPTLRLKNLIRT